MGAPTPNMKAGEQPAAETLLSAFRTISATERRRHASVLNYWLSIRGDKEFPPLHDLDPLELSDAGPSSILFELISGGHDAEIRHMGEALRNGDWPERIMDADQPSILACIAKKLPIVAISRDFLAFEDDFGSGSDKTRCWITLLPLSAGGAWVDYVYALVSTDAAEAKSAKPSDAPARKVKAPEPDVVEEKADDVEEPLAEVGEPIEDEPVVDEPVAQTAEPEAMEPEAETANFDADEPESEPEPVSSTVAKAAPGFSKLLDSIAGLTGFYGSNPVKVEPVVRESGPDALDEAEAAPQADELTFDEPTEEPAVEELIVEEPQSEEPVAEDSVAETPASMPEPIKRPDPVASERTLQTKLADVRAKADEARQARIRASAALIDGLSAAYDFALDAEDAPEEYLRLVEAQGLKIQLRAPMKPVVKLAFDGLADGATIGELEAVLAWALKQDMPRGTLAERIHDAGGVEKILNTSRVA